MRLLALLAALTLAACSTDPSPTPGLDAQTPDAADVVSEFARDVSVAADSDALTIDAPGDAGQSDAAPDRVELVDAVADAAVDAAGDVAVGDASDGAVDAQTDVAVDAGDAAVGADAADGAVTYDLNRAVDALEFHALYTSTCVPGECANAVVESVSGAMDCYVASGEMHFTVGPIVGLVYLGRDAGMGSGVVNYGSLATVAPVLTAGRAYMATGPRQNFRVQFAVTAGSGQSGVTGVPGRTANPSLGEVWAFGCPVR